MAIHIFKSTRFIILGIMLLIIIPGCSKSNDVFTLGTLPEKICYGSTYSFKVTPENGGEIERGALSMLIRPDSVKTNTTIEITTFYGGDVIGGISLKPHGMKFEKPIMMVMPLAEKQEPGACLPLSYRKSSDEQWQPASTKEGMPVNNIVADDGMSLLMFIDHFSEYAVLVQDVIYSTNDMNRDTVLVTGKNYGDGFIRVPMDWYVYEDNINQMPFYNDNDGFSEGISQQMGLWPGLSNYYLREDHYREILENLVLQPEFPDPDNLDQVEEFIAQFYTIRDFFDFVFESVSIPKEDAEAFLDQTRLKMAPIDIAFDGFNGLVYIKKITGDQVLRNLTQYLGHLSNFKFLYKTALSISALCSYIDLINLAKEMDVVFEKSIKDILLLTVLNYELAKERVDALKPFIQLSSDDALKAAFAKVENKFKNENWALIKMIGSKIMDMYYEETLIGIKTFITSMGAYGLTLKFLTTNGMIKAALPVVGAKVALEFLAAKLIIDGFEFLYENFYDVYHTLLKCTLIATLRESLHYSVDYTEEELLQMNYDERRTAVHILMMKVYLAYFYYRGVADVYEQYSWSVPFWDFLKTIFGDPGWEDFWESRHQFLSTRRDLWKDEYTKLLVLLAENPLDYFPPVWNGRIGITNAIPGDEQVTIEWGSATDLSSPPVEYLLYVDTDNNPWDQFPVVVSEIDNHIFSGLTNGQPYWFGVRCQDSANPPNVDNNTNVLSATSFNPDAEPPVWDTYIGITCAFPGDGTVSVSWDSATDLDTPPVKYLIYHDTDDNPWDTVPIITSDNPPYLIGNLQNNVKYWFGVRCCDSADPCNIDDNTCVLFSTPTSSTPNSLNLIKTLPLTGTNMSIKIVDKYAVIVNLQGILRIYDISSPENPALISIYSDPLARYHELIIHKGYAFVLGQYSENSLYYPYLMIIDIQDFYNIDLIKSLKVLDYDNKAGMYRFDIDNSCAYLNMGGCLKIYDIEPIISTHFVAEKTGMRISGNIDVKNGFAYCTDYYDFPFDSWINVYDIRNHYNPILLYRESYQYGASAGDVEEYCGYVFVSALDSSTFYPSVRIFNFNPPDKFQWIGSFCKYYNINDIYIEGNYAYLLGGGDFRVYNISNFSNIQLVTSTNVSADSYDFAIRNNQVFILKPNELRIYQLW